MRFLEVIAQSSGLGLGNTVGALRKFWTFTWLAVPSSSATAGGRIPQTFRAQAWSRPCHAPSFILSISHLPIPGPQYPWAILEEGHRVIRPAEVHQGRR